MIIGKTTNFFCCLFSHFLKDMELIIPFLKDCMPGWTESSMVVDDSLCHHGHHSLPIHPMEELNILQIQHILLSLPIRT